MRSIIILGSSLVILILNIATVGQIAGMEGKYEKAYKSRSGILLIEKILSTLKDAETGERGFVISNKIEFLQPFTIAKEQLVGQLQEIDTYDNFHNEKFSRLKKLSLEQINALEIVINKAKNNEREEALRIILGGEDKARMDAIRVLTADLQNTIKIESHKEREDILQLFSIAKFILFINTISSLGLVMLLIWRVIQVIAPPIYGNKK